MTTDWQDLVQRVDRLERQNRLLRIVCALIVVAALVPAASIAARQPPARDLSSRTFTVVDASQHPRAILGLVGTVPELRLLDEHGHALIRLSLGPDGPSLKWIDRNGHEQEVLQGPGWRPATER